MLFLSLYEVSVILKFNFVLYILKEKKNILCKTRSHLDEVLKTLYPPRDNEHRHHSVVLPSHIITFNKQDLVFKCGLP